MKLGDVYRRAAENSDSEDMFYAGIGNACNNLGVSYTVYRRPAVKYFMGEVVGTRDEFVLAYLLLAAIVEAPGGKKELTTKIADEA